jgi:methylenetetrahydrofolate dehydrogenase (NADP+) / methenyltetrahydrofolate cyclohydrolase
VSARILDGAAIASDLRQRTAAAALDLRSTTGIIPRLAVMLVGENPASKVYVNAKTKQAREVGIETVDYRLPEATTEQDLLCVLRTLNEDAGVNGILVQLPLPAHISAPAILRAIAPQKDVDGFHPFNAGLLATGQTDEAFIPCTPLGCLMLLKVAHRKLAGLNAVVLGRSTIVGRPMAQLLINESLTATVVHSQTRHIAAHCRSADVLIAAVGRPNFLRAEWVKPGATVIDAGINRVSDQGGKSKLAGDVAFDEVRGIAGAITPVPGGVGPMTIACLLVNTTAAAYRQAGLGAPRWP